MYFALQIYLEPSDKKQRHCIHTQPEHDAANNIFNPAMQMVSTAESEPDYQSVLLLPIDEHISACDVQYVALAKELLVPFVTSDQNFMSAVPSHCVDITEYIV
mgnify:CR=1 FL=1